ncbi:MAG: glycosyltransferase family 25 protein [Rhodobacteraceae bacterium]|nr:glycosyltransferase family 25 protein [Paracoccaceae bacterium]
MGEDIGEVIEWIDAIRWSNELDIYLINLSQRRDRMRLMHDQLKAQGLVYERIEAVNGLGDADIGYPKDHPRLSKGEFACYLSHVAVWKRLVDSGAPHCLVLEDDAVLSPSFHNITNQEAFFTHPQMVTRLETRLQGKTTVFRKPILKLEGFSLYLANKCDVGSCAYVLKRTFAQHLLDNHATPRIPVDLLLNDSQQTRSDHNLVAQLVPAICTQRILLDDENPCTSARSDLEQTRRGFQHSEAKNMLYRIKREITYPFIHYWPLGRSARKRIPISFEGSD